MNSSYLGSQEQSSTSFFLCTSKWWWTAEITYVSPGFPTSEIWNIRLRGRFNFFQALKCWAKFFFTKLRINLMTAQFPRSGCQHVTLSIQETNRFCIGLFSPKPQKLVNEAEFTCKMGSQEKGGVLSWQGWLWNVLRQLIHTQEKQVPRKLSHMWGSLASYDIIEPGNWKQQTNVRS